MALRHDAQMRFHRRFLLSSTSFKTPLAGRGLNSRATHASWRLMMGGVLLASFLSVPLLSLAASRDDIMPPPSRAPRTPVERQKLAAPEIPEEMAGGAVAIDGQTLRLKDSSRELNVRLAGIVAPPLTTTEGVTARSTLDMILKDQTVNCSRHDRDSDGRAVMSCTYNGGRDVAQALLATGAVLFSRGNNLPAELAVGYRTAEEMAQTRRQGLWAKAATPTAPAAAQPTAAQPGLVPLVPLVAAAAGEPAAATASAASNTIAPPPTPAQLQQTLSAPIPVVSMTGGAGRTAVAATTAAPTFTVVSNEDTFSTTTIRWMQAMGMLGFLFGMLAWLDARHLRRARFTHDLEIQSERTVVAAALAGELAAARDICESRAAQIASAPLGSRDVKWPRLRTYIYQAHVEHIGLLGPTLARQIASIYGQMADYGGKADTEGNVSPSAMARTLARLCGYIEITLEGLTEVEQTGEPYYPTGLLADNSAADKRASQLAQQIATKPSSNSNAPRLPETPGPNTGPSTRTRTLPQSSKSTASIPAAAPSSAGSSQPSASTLIAPVEPTPAPVELEETEIGLPKEARVEAVVEAPVETPVVETLAEVVAEKAPTGPQMKPRNPVAAPVTDMIRGVEETTVEVVADVETPAETTAEKAPIARPAMNSARSQRLMRQRQRAAEILKQETASLQQIDGDTGETTGNSNEAVA